MSYKITYIRQSKNPIVHRKLRVPFITMLRRAVNHRRISVCLWCNNNAFSVSNRPCNGSGTRTCLCDLCHPACPKRRPAPTDRRSPQTCSGPATSLQPPSTRGARQSVYPSSYTVPTPFCSVTTWSKHNPFLLRPDTWPTACSTVPPRSCHRSRPSRHARPAARNLYTCTNATLCLLVRMT